MRRKAPTRAAWCLVPALFAVCGVKSASAQLFMSEAEALKIISPQTDWIEDTKVLDEQARTALMEQNRLRFPETTYRFQVASAGGQPVAFALTLDEIGKSEPITFTVGLDPSGKVTQVILLVFRESRGGEVRDKRFLRQFRGKSARDPIQVNRDILSYPGATLSSKAIARGVRRAIALFHHFYGAGSEPRATMRIEPPRAAERSMATRRRVSGAAHAGPHVRYVQARYLMGTVCAVELYAPDRERGRQAANAAFDAMRDVERRMSSFMPESELSLLNRNARAGHPVEVSEDLFEVLDFARQVSNASDGAFDITVAPLLRAWGFLPAASACHKVDDRCDGEPSVSTQGEREAARAAVDYRNVRLNPHACSVEFTRPGVEIDLGGIAKGYAVDKAVQALREQGIRSARVSAGGSTLYALGAPPHDLAGWELTLPTGKTIVVRDAAVSSSGHSQRYVEISGRRFSHIFNPRLGRPVITDVATVSIRAPTAMESDALTKPFFILNERRQENLLKRFPDIRVFMSRAPALQTSWAAPAAEAKEVP